MLVNHPWRFDMDVPNKTSAEYSREFDWVEIDGVWVKQIKVVVVPKGLIPTFWWILRLQLQVWWESVMTRWEKLRKRNASDIHS